jgi:hypothetical protein
MVFDLGTLTTVHTAISLLAILFGVLALVEMLGVALPSFVGVIFLLLAFLTSATGFLFPFNSLLPSHIVGGIALAVLAVALLARYAGHLAGAWRWIYSVMVVASVYFLIFVGVAQAFAKIPALQGLAPTQSEPPFAIAQLVVLAIFIAIGIGAARRFQPNSLSLGTSSRLAH